MCQASDTLLAHNFDHCMRFDASYTCIWTHDLFRDVNADHLITMI